MNSTLSKLLAVAICSSLVLLTGCRQPQEEVITLHEITLNGVYISPETLTQLSKMMADGPPRGCHMEVRVTPDGIVIYECKGRCPESEGCGFQEGSNGDYSFWCACKGGPKPEPGVGLTMMIPVELRVLKNLEP